MKRPELVQAFCSRCGELCNPSIITGDRREVICGPCQHKRVNYISEFEDEHNRMMQRRQLFFEIMGLDLISKDETIGVKIIDDVDELEIKLAIYEEEKRKRGLD